MNLTINFFHKATPVQLDIFMDEVEPFTKKTWGSLYQQSQQSFSPLFYIAIMVIQDSNQLTAKPYDGLALNSRIKPLNHKNSFTVYNCFFHCFDIAKTSENSGNQKNQEAYTLPLFSLGVPSLSSFQFSDLNNEQLENLALTGLEREEKNSYRKGKIQYIIGSFLNQQPDETKRLEGLRWIWCAAQHQICQSNTLLGMLCWQGILLQKNNKLARQYLEQSSQEGDVQASTLLEIIRREESDLPPDWEKEGTDTGTSEL